MKLLALAVAFFCTAFTHAAVQGKLASVGSFDGSEEITNLHITNLLLSHGIESFIGGFWTFYIQVPLEKKAEAERLLREDANRRGYRIWVSHHRAIGREPKLTPRLQRIPLNEALQQKDYSKKTALGRFLRSKKVASLTAKYPFVESFSVFGREYLLTPRTLATEYQVKLQLRSRPAKHGIEYTGNFQVLDHGRVIHFRAANEGEY